MRSAITSILSTYGSKYRPGDIGEDELKCRVAGASGRCVARWVRLDPASRRKFCNDNAVLLRRNGFQRIRLKPRFPYRVEFRIIN